MMNQRAAAISTAIKMSMEEEAPTGIPAHRTKFLESLEEQFPESMRQNMNFSMDPCRYRCGKRELLRFLRFIAMVQSTD